MQAERENNASPTLKPDLGNANVGKIILFSGIPLCMLFCCIFCTHRILLFETYFFTVTNAIQSCRFELSALMPQG